MASVRTLPLGTLLKRHRVAAGLTQEDLAERTGVSTRAIGDLERGVTRRARRDTLALLAEALQLSAEDRADFEAAVRQRDDTAAPAAIPPPPPHNLPVPLTPLIGRERDEAAVAHLLQQPEVRLLTLTGAPGIGKTRLAVQVAAGLSRRFADGVRFVALAPVREPDSVLPTIAQTLGPRDPGGQPLATALAASLRNQELLLVLDNFEQVLAAAPQVAELLAACPAMKALVTSRAALHVRGEHELAVPPLALPDQVHLPPVEDLGQVAAVSLFVQRARAVKPTFALASTNAPAVAAICHRLDGLPLAIELAAARSKLLSPQALLARLEQRLQLLTGGAQDLPERQRTLARAIEWSYELLDAAEQRLFRRLSIFVGSCTLEAADAVCNVSGDLGTSVLVGLAALMDKSLVQQEEDPENGEPRFRLLETLREYGQEQMAASGELDALLRHHADYYLAMARRAWTTWEQGERGDMLQRLDPEYANLRAALALSQTVASDKALSRFVTSMFQFWLGHGWLIERQGTHGGEPMPDELSARIAASTETLMDVVWLARAQRRYGGPNTQLEAHLARLRAKGDPQDLTLALRMAALQLRQHDKPAAQALLAECVAVLREVGDTWGLAQSLYSWGDLALEQGDYATARARHEESLTLFRSIGDEHGSTYLLTSLGRIACVEGSYASARALVEAGLAIRCASGGKWLIAISLNSLGDVARCEERFEEAAALFQESLALNRDVADTAGVAWSVHNLGQVALRAGDERRARALFAEGLGIRQKRTDTISC